MAQFNRPEHPDFWMLSEIVISQDAAVDNKAITFEEVVNKVVDVHSLAYMAQQRAMRISGPYAPVSEQSKIAAVYMDAFLTGAAFQAKKNEQASE
jgi:hypothetical protein